MLRGGWRHSSHLTWAAVRRTSHSSTTILDLYRDRVESGRLIHDPEQEKVIHSLEQTSTEINNYLHHVDQYWRSLYAWQQERHRRLEDVPSERSWFGFGGSNVREEREQLLAQYHKLMDPNLSNIQKLKQAFVHQLTSGSRSWPELHQELIQKAQRKIIEFDREYEKKAGVSPLPPRPPSPKGIYLYGQVGTGKTMTMSLLLESFQTSLPPERMEIVNYSRCTERSIQSQAAAPASALSELPSHSPFETDPAHSPPMRIIWSHFSDFLRHCYRSMHYFNNQMASGHAGEYTDAIDGCISSLVGYRMERDPPGRLSSALLGKRIDPSVSQLMRRVPLPPMIVFFDEFQMIDIGDGSVVKGVFERLINNGSVIVTSCNLPPKHLLQISSQSQDIQDFTELLCESMKVISLPSNVARDQIIDYRKHHYEEGLQSHEESNRALFFSHEEHNRFNQFFTQTVGQNPTKKDHKLEIANYKRFLTIPEASDDLSVCRFTFEELCSRELSSVDYSSLAKQFPVIFLDHIPELSIKWKNEVRRFIWLIDQVYNQQAVLVCHSEKPLEDIFRDLPSDMLDTHDILENLQFERSDNYGKFAVDTKAISQFSGKSEKFAFTRALSRLREFQTRRYLAQVPHSLPV